MYSLLFMSVLSTGLLASVVYYKWNQALDKNDIIVFTRWVPDFAIKEFKGEVDILSDMDTVFNIISHTEHYLSWFPNCIEATFLKKIGPNKILVYMAFDQSPFFVKDMTMEIYSKKVKGHYHMKMKHIPHLHVSKLDRDAMDVFIASLSISKNQKEGVHVTYQGRLQIGKTNLNTRLFNWLANRLVKVNPYKLLKRIRAQAEKSQ